jgi:TPR repeat protein
MFGRLADPQGPNNALSQVLYGLALRHGWGIDTDPEKAVMYLQSAAKNSAAVEEEALRAGMKKGGKAKGELVLAIYEVSNRHHTFCAAPLQSKSGIYTIHTHVFLMP